MDISSYVLLSQEQALRRRMDVVANNLANMNTVGFKREQPVFREYVEDTTSAVKPAEKTSFVLDYGAVHDASNGAFQPTGNPLDVMIDGPGYLAVQSGDGTTAYTRAGYVKVLESGELATAGGQVILGEFKNQRRDKDRTVARLPTVADLFPETCDPSLEGEDTGPSCSLAEALEKQSLFVNRGVALYALNLLFELFRYGGLSHHGVFVNLKNARTSPLPIDPETWKRFGYGVKPKRSRKTKQNPEKS